MHAARIPLAALLLGLGLVLLGVGGELLGDKRRAHLRHLFG